MTTPPAGARIVLPDPAGASYERHLQLYGPMPAVPDLIAWVDEAGLRGRGGGWFPTAIKMRSVQERAGRFRNQPYVVGNGMEGEPLSLTDQWLLHNSPHLVLDGLEAAVAAVGARDCALAVHEGTSQGHSVREALAQRPAPVVPIHIVEAPGRYVASEESALARFVGGGPEMPVYGARPFESGIHGRPTLVNNAETLADVALIARFGARWFADVGTPDAPGTVLITLGGAVARPGEYEVPVGTTPARIIEIAGGPTTGTSGILTGGFGGTWAHPDRILHTEWSPDGMREHGVSIGAGVLWLQPEDSCGVRAIADISAYMAGESAGQCGMCTFGLSAVSEDLGNLARMHLDPAGYARLRSRLTAIPRRGGCGLPDGAIRMYTTGLEVFADDVTAHLDGRCLAPGDGAARMPVPTPRPHPVIAAGKEFR